MSKLFEKLKIRDVAFRNRLWISPMCQYSSVDGMPTDWHLVHLGSRAVGGAGLVIVEATAVVPEGRISPADSGIWSEEHAQAFARITAFIKQQGAVAAIQIAHAGRKASTAVPWLGSGAVMPTDGGWQVVGPSDRAFAPDFPEPQAMTHQQIEQTVAAFQTAARRAVNAGFEVVEIHSAHGYLLHEFLSPLSNDRADEFGGDLENRMRFPLMVAEAVRKEVPETLPVFVRISATDWVEGGWDVGQSVQYALRLRELGIDLIDTSTGGNVPRAEIPLEPGYQVRFAREIREKAGIKTGAVGLITEPLQAEQIIAEGSADAVLIARESLRDPFFPFKAARELGGSVDVPKQYLRAIEI